MNPSENKEKESVNSNTYSQNFLKLCVLCQSHFLLPNVWFISMRSSFVVVILKRDYKYICSYPDDVELCGHCVIKRANNNETNANNINLLSFGGSELTKRHTLMMKYVSVWDNEEGNSIEETIINFNQWIPFTDNNNKPICIGSDEDNYKEACAVIGGINNHLLFITHYPYNISVFNLSTFQFINYGILPTDNCWISYPCFVIKASKDNLKNEMLLFCGKTGLSIKYDEKDNTLEYHKLRVCSTIRLFCHYGYVCMNDIVLFFGGWGTNDCVSNVIYKYYINEKKWIKCKHTLPMPLYNCAAILNEDGMYVHVIGGNNEEDSVFTHMKTNAKIWMKDEEIEERWDLEEEEKKQIEEIKKEIGRDFDFNKLKVEVNFFELKLKEIKTIIGYWYRLLFTKMGWIDDFDIIILRYILLKYFKPLKVLCGHSGYVNSVKFSPDGTKIVSSSNDNTVRIWDIMSGKEIRVLKGHSNYVINAIFSSDSTTIISFANDNTIQFWDVESGLELKKLEGPWSTKSSRFSPDGNTLVSIANDYIIRLWDVSSKEEIKKFEGHTDDIRDVQFSPDGHSLVSASNDKAILLWNLNTGERIKKLTGHPGYVITAKFSSDGRFIVSCSRDKTIRIWDVMSGKTMKILDVPFLWMTDVKFFPDNQTLISFSREEKIWLWDIQIGIEIQILEGHSSRVTGVDISTDGDTIVSCSHDTTIRLWSCYSINHKK
ncbi:WD-40 repeat protein [Reticulomyxa filosa]|uniref:WD-40 repeat protein n=1 Tax=Reticulomyxa filosa TaxID=46433 RepID=X6LYY1_RETFI|nr:WD-40 repeat protein [Reticulomyxa filosa]|eukprot:ETO05920.1 WD-40 repeat protein [Reticulomyxa filosa]